MKLRSQQYYSMMAFAVLTVILLFANAFITTYIVLTLKLYQVCYTYFAPKLFPLRCLVSI